MRHTSCALVTGVQTCALPISYPLPKPNDPQSLATMCGMPCSVVVIVAVYAGPAASAPDGGSVPSRGTARAMATPVNRVLREPGRTCRRSDERSVGTEWSVRVELGGRRIIKKKITQYLVKTT